MGRPLESGLRHDYKRSSRDHRGAKAPTYGPRKRRYNIRTQPRSLCSTQTLACRRFRSHRYPLALAVAVVTLAVPVSPAHAAPRLQVLGQSTLNVKASSGKGTKDAFVSVLNTGTEDATVTVTFQASSSATVKATVAPANRITPGQVGRIKVTFSGLREVTDKVDGQLVFTGGASPVARTVSVSPAPQPAIKWPLWLVVAALVAAAILYGRVRIATGPKELRLEAPGPKWKFDESWATTLTAVGGILGTILGGVTYPDAPRQIDKDTLVELSALFAAIVVVAPFLLRALGKKEPASLDDPGLWTTNRGLLRASALTFGAVIGELGTLALLGWELAQGSWWRWAAVAAIATLGLLASRYAWITASENAKADWKKLKAEADKAAPPQTTTYRLTDEVLEADRPTVAVAVHPGVRRLVSPPSLL
jgi:hypothetical protein